ncbi:MAG: hypothetical protein AB1640_03940 [bacterium]
MERAVQENRPEPRPNGPLRSCYQILNTAVSIETDSAELLRLFDRDYAWFRVPRRHAGTGGARLDCRLRLEGNTRAPYLDINGEKASLEGHPNPASCACHLLLSRLFESCGEFVLLHAAVVAREQGAVILAGPPGAGKTTLALSLLEKGLSFFSDDVCPVHRKTRLVHPFPRSAWVRLKDGEAGPAVRTDAVCRPAERLHPFPRSGKALSAADRLSGRVGSRPLEATHLFYLAPGEEDRTVCTLEIGLKEGSEEPFFRGLAAIESDIQAEPLGQGTASGWRIRYPSGRGLSGRLREFLCEHREAIWNVFRDDEVRPDFSQAPHLTRLSVHEAAFRLLGDLKQCTDNPARHAAGVPGRPGRLLLEMAGLLRETACYRLSPGRLEARRDLVLELLRSSPSLGG